jgi:NAD(P)H-quinone oxidoreductase subunit 5
MPWLLLSLAFTAWAAQHLAQPASSAVDRFYQLASGAITVVVLTAVYLGFKTAIAQGLPEAPAGAKLAADLWVAGWLVALAAASYSLQRWPLQPRLRRVWIALNAGLYLDEWMTRLTLRLWPLTLTAAPTQPILAPAEVKS